MAGDGRMDSPGHSAKFCTYTVMNQADKKIVAMEIIDKRETQLKSGQMEVKGFRKTMDDIRGAGVEVTEIVTDAHPQISAIMRKCAKKLMEVIGKILFISDLPSCPQEMLLHNLITDNNIFGQNV